MPEQVGVFWVTQIGSGTLAIVALVMIYSFAKERAHLDAIRVMALLRATGGEGLDAKQIRDFARRSEHAQWQYERETRNILWACYAVGIFSAPGLAETLGNVDLNYDQDGFLEWVNIESADGIVTMAVAAFIVARIYAWRVFAFHRTKQFAELRDEFNFPRPSASG